MGLLFYEDDGCIKPAKGRVVCIEHDGDISCFELGDLPPQPEDPKELGIVFPCCVKFKKPLSKKKPTTLNVRKQDNKKQGKGVSDSDQRISNNLSRTSSEEYSCPLKNSNRNQDCILYVFDKNGFKKAISYTKANLNCKKNTAEPKRGKSGKRDEPSDNRKERIYGVSLKTGKSLRGSKSRELRGGVLYTDCFCLRRNGLQYDCRRTGCQNSPLCSVLPAPVCDPSQVACITHCANPHAEELSRICKLRPWCSPCGPMVCYKYEDCGPPLQCLPRSAFKRNGLQDCQFFQQGSIRYLCRADCCCPRPCPCCPPCVRRPPPGKTYVTRFSDFDLRNKPLDGGPSRGQEDGENKTGEKENQLKRTKSRELRGGIMYYSCHCIKRNGLQHDCRRTGCGGEPACLVLPDPLCAPSQLARARGLADPAALAAHTGAQGGGGSGGPAASGSGGKRFIVCELKGIVPDAGPGADRGNKCCKCPAQFIVPTQAFSSGAKPLTPVPTQAPMSGGLKHNCICTGGAAPVKTAPNPPPNSRAPGPCSCSCKVASGRQNMASSVYAFDENTMNEIMKRFDKKELAPSEEKVVGPGGRIRNPSKSIVPKEEPCTRPGCVHWQPPPPCVWDLPCKADCFEAHPGIKPGRNPLTGGGGSSGTSRASGRNLQSQGSQRPREIMKLLTPECCTGCSAPGGGGAMASGGPAAGLPMLVMKLC